MICGKLYAALYKIKDPVIIKELSINIFRYALGLSKQRSHIKIQAKRHDLPELLEIKFFADHSYYVLSSYWRSVLKSIITGKIKEASEEFNISERDIRFVLDEVDLSKKEVSTLKMGLIKPRLYSKDELFIIANNHIYDYINYLVKNKLRFIYESNNLSKGDFVTEMQISALSFLYKRDWEFKDKLIRSAKTSMKNSALTKLRKFTTQSRSRIISGNNGWENTVAGTDTVENIEAVTPMVPVINYQKIINNCSKKQAAYLNVVTDSKVNHEFEASLDHEPRTFLELINKTRTFFKINENDLFLLKSLTLNKDCEKQIKQFRGSIESMITPLD